MVWSPTCAASAYLDTVKLCKHHQETNHDVSTPTEPNSNEFISALAAGMSAQLIVQVSTEASHSTVALAAAARRTGGRLICILPEESLAASEQFIHDSGLDDIVEFKVGNPYELLHQYENIDFSVVDCKNAGNAGLLKLLDVNPLRSVVVANNLVGEREGLGGEIRNLKKNCKVRSIKHPIGEGMEVTMIGKSDEFGIHGKRVIRSGGHRKRSKSRWVTRIAEDSGEEHIFRVPRSC